MTNLEVLCTKLREIGRPDAAQILESRTYDDWCRLSERNRGRVSLLFAEQREPLVALTLLRCFSWGPTPEEKSSRYAGRSFWGEVDVDLWNAEPSA
jgi:hypothetical protein